MADSYVHGASSTPLLGETIGTNFRNTVARHADRTALVVRPQGARQEGLRPQGARQEGLRQQGARQEGLRQQGARQEGLRPQGAHQEGLRQQGVRWSYAQMLAHAENVAANLLAAGLEPGERVGIWSPNNAEWALTQYATALAGLVLVNINPSYRLAEVEYAINKVGCAAIVTATRFKTSEYVAMLDILGTEKLPTLRHRFQIGGETQRGYRDFAELMQPAPEAARARLHAIGARLQSDDPINIQFTSGTTGAPKGATLTHHNILNNGFFVAEAQRITHEDRICIPVPLYHCFGMVMGNLGCTTHGATMVYPGEGFDPAATLAAVAEERCTSLYGVPTMFIAQLNHPDFATFDLSSLRTGIMAGSPCPIEVMRRCIADMNMAEVTIAYGMTETSPVSFQSSTSDSVERRVSTVGRVQPHIEVKIVDGEGRVVPRGTTGELCTRGYSVMLGYWGEEARTREAIDAAGWMHTGDLAVIDEEGFCNIVGRIKDLVIRGGENVYPREVEEFLFRHPKVAEVQVIGVPDTRYGEEICAWIRLKPGEACTAQEIQEFCRDQIAHYKVPKLIRFVEEFPMTVTGKVQKYLMRERMIEELGIEVQKTA